MRNIKSDGAASRRNVELGTVLAREFFNRDPRLVGRELLGKILVRRDGRKKLVGRVVEVEAYLGKDDPAAHSFGGPTPRNQVMFGPPGFAYVYFIYGNHYCLNVSCQPEGQAGAVLFRALEPLTGIEEMALLRGMAIENPRDLPKLTSGPGRMAEALGVTRERDNGKDLTSTRSDLWLADDAFIPERVAVTKRIGITKAADRPWRYAIAGNRFVSGPKNLT
jgi:DNA-3-methyladenine glycosylase